MKMIVPLNESTTIIEKYRDAILCFVPKDCDDGTKTYNLCLKKEGMLLVFVPYGFHGRNHLSGFRVYYK